MSSSSFWSTEQVRWTNYIVDWMQVHIQFEDIETCNLKLKITPDLCIPEECKPLLKLKYKGTCDEGTIIISVDMSVHLWKDFIHGSSKFCKNVLKETMLAFGFFSISTRVPYDKTDHYYSFVCFDMDFEKSDVKPPKQGTEEVVAH